MWVWVLFFLIFYWYILSIWPCSFCWSSRTASLDTLNSNRILRFCGTWLPKLLQNDSISWEASVGWHGLLKKQFSWLDMIRILWGPTCKLFYHINATCIYAPTYCTTDCLRKPFWKPTFSLSEGPFSFTLPCTFIVNQLQNFRFEEFEHRKLYGINIFTNQLKFYIPFFKLNKFKMIVQKGDLSIWDWFWQLL